MKSATFLLPFDDNFAATFGEWASGFFEAINPALAHFEDFVDPITAGAFLAGAIAATTGARLALLGAASLVLANLAVVSGFLAEVPQWAAPLAITFILLGALQGVLTLVVGEQAAGTLLVAAIVGTIVFILWRGPTRTFRLVGAATLRMARR